MLKRALKPTVIRFATDAQPPPAMSTSHELRICAGWTSCEQERQGGARETPSKGLGAWSQEAACLRTGVRREHPLSQAGRSGLGHRLSSCQVRPKAHESCRDCCPGRTWSDVGFGELPAGRTATALHFSRCSLLLSGQHFSIQRLDQRFSGEPSREDFRRDSSLRGAYPGRYRCLRSGCCRDDNVVKLSGQQRGGVVGKTLLRKLPGEAPISPRAARIIVG